MVGDGLIFQGVGTDVAFEFRESFGGDSTYTRGPGAGLVLNGVLELANGESTASEANEGIDEQTVGGRLFRSEGGKIGDICLVEGIEKPEEAEMKGGEVEFG